MTPVSPRKWWLVAAVAVTTCVWLVELAARRIGLAVVVLPAAWLFLHRQVPRRLLLGVLITSPIVSVPGTAALSTAVAYARGKATLARTAAGYPAEESNNLHPVYRAFPRGGGCAPELGPTVYAYAERATFTALFGGFGTMPGAYTGLYLDRAAARARVARRLESIHESDWESGSFVLHGRTVQVDRRWRARIGQDPVLRVSAGAEGDLAIVLVETERYDFVTQLDLGGLGWFATYRYPVTPR